MKARTLKSLTAWLSLVFVFFAGVSLLWPVNNPLLSGECIGGKRENGLCPIRWDHVDTGSLPASVVITVVLLASIILLIRFPRWYTYLIALVPLLFLSFLGLFVFGPVYVPALLVLTLSAFLKVAD